MNASWRFKQNNFQKSQIFWIVCQFWMHNVRMWEHGLLKCLSMQNGTIAYQNGTIAYPISVVLFAGWIIKFHPISSSIFRSMITPHSNTENFNDFLSTKHRFERNCTTLLRIIILDVHLDNKLTRTILSAVAVFRTIPCNCFFFYRYQVIPTYSIIHKNIQTTAVYS